MEWIREHLGPVIGGGLVTCLLLFWQRKAVINLLVTRLWTIPKNIHQTDAELIKGQAQLMALRTSERDEANKQCEELKAANAELDKEVKAAVRQLLLREAINREDTDYIRALTTRLRSQRVDYADINAEFKRND